MFNPLGNISSSITECFEQTVFLNSEKIAIINGKTTVTYDCLNRKANQLAHFLVNQYNYKQGETIAIFADSSEWAIISMLAILKVGCVYLPIDSKYPEERIKYIIQDSQAFLILTEQAFLERIKFSTCPIHVIEELEVKISTYSASNLVLRSTTTWPAYIMYTSGTTGTPNGVLIPQKGIIRLVNSDYIPFEEELTFLQLAPLGFDASTFEIWGALLHGNKLVIYRYHIPEFSKIKEFIQEYGVTCLWLTAALFNAIIDESPEILTGIKYLLTGGEALSVSHIQKAQKELPDTTFINGYGPTECTTFACTYTIPDSINKDLKSIPIGKPIALTYVYLLDKQAEIVSDGEIGELHIGGDGLALEYLNNKELTKKRFITYKTKENTEIRLYKTGDLCRKLKDETIDFVGRIDHQVKINGFRIEIAEIEACLKKHTQISDAIVLVQQKGENKKLIAYIVSIDESSKKQRNSTTFVTKNIVDQVELNRYLSKWLPSFMIPGTIIEIGNLPLNSNGKIDRQTLLNIEIKPEKPNKIEKFIGIEDKIRLLCEKIVSIKINNKNENLFELGGESLSIAQLIFHISQEYNVEIPINHFYNEPTLSTIFKIIKNEDTEEFDLINRRIIKANEAFESNNLTDYSNLENEYSIIQIKKGKGDPLFIAPGLFGNAFSFVEFANKISIHNPIFVLEYPKNREGRFVITDMIDLAKYFLFNIKRIQDKGNFQLLGYSFGGRLIFEIAHQLELENYKTSFLGIIDSEGVDAKNLVNKSRIKFEISIFYKLPFFLKIKFLNNRIFRKLLYKFKDKFVPKPEQLKQQVQKQNLLEGDFYKTWYSFNPDYCLTSNLHLFKGSDEDPKWLLYYVKHLFPDLFFKNNIKGELIIEEINCDHNGFFKSPHIHKLTELIERIFENK